MRRRSSLEDVHLAKQELYGKFLDDLFDVDNTSLGAVESFVKARQEGRRKRRGRKASVTEETLREFKTTMAEIRDILVSSIDGEHE